MAGQTISTPEAPGHLNFMAQGIGAKGFVFAVTVPRDSKDLKIPETFEMQAQFAFKNLATVLAAGNSSIRDLVKLTVYLSNMENWGAMNEVYKEYINLEAPPVRCTVEIARLNNDYMIELDAIALAREA